MASIIRIKRSPTSGNPSTLAAGELAYSALSGTQNNGGDRLYVGFGTETAGDAANHYVIGGKYFTDMMDHVTGTLTANSALLVDANSKLDNLKVDNLDLNGNTISSTDANGNIVLDPDGTGYVSLVGTNGVVIPAGTTAQRGPTVQGTVRYNTDTSSFEGYSGTTWGSLGGVKSVDGLTYVIAETSAGASNGELEFYVEDGAGTGSTKAMGINNAGVTIAGNLTVNGTTTTVNSTTLTVDDKNIELASVNSPTDITADGGGITLKGATDKTFNWISATSSWTSSEDLNLLSSKVYKINGTSVLSASTLGSGVTASSLTSVGTITSGTWQGTAIADAYVANDLTISGGTVNNTPIGATTASSGAFTTLGASGAVTFTSATASSSSTTGALVVTGGVGIGGNLYGAGAATSTLDGFNIDGGTY